MFEESDGYEAVYKWFNYLKENYCYILAYVIMPNHLHVLLYPTNPDLSLNKLVGNGKRFMAYDIVSRLTSLNKKRLLQKLRAGVQRNEVRKGKKHQVFQLSFDARICYDMSMLEQKLDYIHHNPVKGNWKLASDYCEYKHSSASYYEGGDVSNDIITHYKEIGE